MTKQNLIDNKTGVGEGFQLDTGQTLMTSLLGFWPLKEASGSRYDSQGVFNLTQSGSVSVNSAGITGNCAVFSGAAGNFLYHADSTLLPTGHTDMSASCWVRFDALGASEYAFCHFNSAGNQAGWTIFKWTDNKIYFSVSHDGTNVTQAVAADAISVDTWYHVVAYHDATADEIGLIIDNGTPVTTAHATGIFDTNSNLIFGDAGQGATVLDGRLCDVGLWNKVLTAQEIKDLYNLGNGNTITR